MKLFLIALLYMGFWMATIFVVGCWIAWSVIRGLFRGAFRYALRRK